jgi:hypothetical protein
LGQSQIVKGKNAKGNLKNNSEKFRILKKEGFLKFKVYKYKKM